MPRKTPDPHVGQYDLFAERLQKIAKRGLLTSAIFAGLIGASVFLINLEGAVVSQAVVTPTGDNKIVQHREGGVIEALLVNNGDPVKAGQPLIILNKKSVLAEYNILRFRRIELEAKLSRLKARQDSDGKFSYTLPAYARLDEDAQQIVATQKKLFKADYDANLATQQKLTERIGSLQTEILALETQITTTQQQNQLIERQLADMLPLVAEQLIPKVKEWELRRSLISVSSQLDSLNVTKVKLHSNLTDTQNELKQFIANYEQDTLTQIEQTEAELQAAIQGYINLEDQLGRQEIKAPVSGKVHELDVFNTGGVIRPGAVVMKIVPQDQGVILSAKVKPVDIDQIYIGQKTRLRFDAFDINKTPELWGHVTHIAPDMSVDEQTGLAFFSVTIELDPEELSRLGNVEILTGMPATAMITTEKRTLFSYLTKPLVDQGAKAFQ